MNNNQFLIPANTKKGMLILSIFRPIDLFIFGGGLSVTFILLLIFSGMQLGTTGNVIAIIPAGICTALVIPIPNYHNVMVALGEVINFFTNNRNYVWRGWCAKYEARDKTRK